MADIEYKMTKGDEGRYLREILRNRLLFSSRLIRKVKWEGKILLNGKSARLNDCGVEGDILSVDYPKEENFFEPEDIPVKIIYEDKSLLICDKPAGMIVHPTKNFQSGTLANALSQIMAEKGEIYKPHFVNFL